LHPVAGVVGVRAQVEVAGPETGRVVAAVKDVQAASRIEIEVEVGSESMH
jgi:hypothetical protein